MAYRTKSLQRKGKLNSGNGIQYDGLTIEQRGRALRRIAKELIAGSAKPSASFGPPAAEFDVMAHAVAAIAHRARISLPHAAVIAELAKIGGGRQ